MSQQLGPGPTRGLMCLKGTPTAQPGRPVPLPRFLPREGGPRDTTPPAHARADQHGAPVFSQTCEAAPVLSVVIPPKPNKQQPPPRDISVWTKSDLAPAGKSDAAHPEPVWESLDCESLPSYPVVTVEQGAGGVQ